MRFRRIDAEKAELPVGRLCMLLDVSPSGYYAWRSRKPSRRQLDDMVFLAHIRAHFAASRRTYGSPRIHVELSQEGLAIGRHRIARLMSENGLRANQTGPNRVRIREVELAAGGQVTLETGFGRIAGVDDGVRFTAGVGVQAAGAMTLFTLNAGFGPGA